MESLVRPRGLTIPCPINGLAPRSLERGPYIHQWLSGRFGTRQGRGKEIKMKASD